MRREEANGEDGPVVTYMSNVRRIRHDRSLLHVETPPGIVTIRAGLVALSGKPVDSVQVMPDDDAVRDGLANTRLIGKARLATSEAV